MEERVVGVGVGFGLCSVATADGALLRGRRGNGKDEGLGGVGGGALERGETASLREEDVVMLDLGLSGNGEIERVFYATCQRPLSPSNIFSP